MARNLVHFDPFDGLETVRRDWFDGGIIRALRDKLPATDVYTEDDKQLIVETQLPSFSETDISVNVDNGALVIQAERHEKEEDKKKQYVLRESSTSYYRSIALPDQADEANISAHFDNGVLTVTVPLAEVASPKKIAIASGNPQREVSGATAEDVGSREAQNA